MRLSLTRNLSVVTVFFVLALSQSTAAQNPKKDWNSVQKLKPGSKLVVKTRTDKRKVSGVLIEVTSDSLTLSGTGAPAQQVSIKKDDVTEIRRKSGGYLATMIGLCGGIGAGGGYGIGYWIGERHDARFRPEYPTAAFGSAVGATIGFFLGNKGDVIYKVR